MAVPFSFFGCWFFRRLSRQSPGACGSTIAVRSRRSGLPRPHPRTPSASYGFPRAYRLPARPGGLPRQALPAATSRQQGRTVCLGFSPRILGGGGSCGARSRPAARAAFGSLRIVLRRDVFRFACRLLCWRSALVLCGVGRLCGVVPCRPRGRPRGLGGVLRFVMPLRAGEERTCGACLKPAARAAF